MCPFTCSVAIAIAERLPSDTDLSAILEVFENVFPLQPTATPVRTS